jgi:hypothetical protein
VTDYRLRALHAALAILVITAAGCATTAPTPLTITDPKQLVGSWIGYVKCRECAMDFRSTLLIGDDATWVVSVQQGGTIRGTIGVVNGELRWGQGGRWQGRVTVAEQGGREYLSILNGNGTVWTEFERSK